MDKKTEDVNLAEAMLRNIALFELSFKAKDKEKSWNTIMNITEIATPQKKWKTILDKFVSGDLKGL